MDSIGFEFCVLSELFQVIKHKVHRLTVLDEDGKLAGVLSRGDIMRATLKTMQTSLSDAQ